MGKHAKDEHRKSSEQRQQGAGQGRDAQQRQQEGGGQHGGQHGRQHGHQEPGKQRSDEHNR